VKDELNNCIGNNLCYIKDFKNILRKLKKEQEDVCDTIKLSIFANVLCGTDEATLD